MNKLRLKSILIICGALLLFTACAKQSVSTTKNTERIIAVGGSITEPAKILTAPNVKVVFDFNVLILEHAGLPLVVPQNVNYYY